MLALSTVVVATILAVADPDPAPVLSYQVVSGQEPALRIQIPYTFGTHDLVARAISGDLKVRSGSMALVSGRFQVVLRSEHIFTSDDPAWSQAVRALPIAVTFDMHGNMSERIVRNATVINGYKSYPHTDMYEAGGIGLVARELQKRDLIHAGAPSVDGGTLGDLAQRSEETPGQEVVVSIDTPIKPTGG